MQDRKKRDVADNLPKSKEDLTIRLNTTDEIKLEDLLYDDLSNKTENQRQTRQLRPSLVVRSPWQYSNEEQRYKSQRPNVFKPSLQVGSNYSPMITGPSSTGASQYYKTGSRYYEEPNYKSDYNPYSSSYKNNYNSQDDSYSNIKQSTNSPHISPHVYTTTNSGYNFQNKKPTSESPENFSYFHMGGNSNKNTNQRPNQYTTTKNPFYSYSGNFYNTQPTKPVTTTNQYRVPEIKSNAAPIYESGNNFFNYNYQTVSPKYYTTTQSPIKTSTTERITPNFFNNNYFHGNVFLENLGNALKKIPSAHNYQVVHDMKKVNYVPETTTKNYGFYITTPTPVQTTKKPEKNLFSNFNFDFDKFVKGIRDTHIAHVDPEFMEKLNEMKENSKNISSSFINKSTPRPFQSTPYKHIYTTTKTTTTTTPSSLDEYYYDDEEEEEEIIRKPVKPKISSVIRQNGNKPYDGFSNNVVPQSNSGKDDEEYDEDEYYYDDEEFDIKHPPPSKSKFSPMTETMSPKLNRTSVTRPTQFLIERTTEMPTTSSSIPPIITFPQDIFQNLRPVDTLPRYLNKSTLRPYTVRQRIRPTEIIQTTTDYPSTILTQSTTTTTTTTTAPMTTRKTYTIRPNRNRGNLRWKTTKKTKNIDDGQLELDEKLPNR